LKNDINEIKHDLKEHYNLDAESYHKRHYKSETIYSPLRYRQKYIEGMISSINLESRSKILDVGCGPGELVVSLFKSDYEVWGIDISEGMINEAKTNLEENGIKKPENLSTGDIENLEFKDDFFNVVIASGVIEYQKTDNKALLELKRVLCPKGYLIINVTNRYAYINWLDNLYRWVKRKETGRKILNYIKQDILHKGPLNMLPERRTHTVTGFDKKLREYGFKKISYNFFHYSPLPCPFDSVFTGLCYPAGKYMEKFSRSTIGRVFGGGYLVLAQKN